MLALIFGRKRRRKRGTRGINDPCQRRVDLARGNRVGTMEKVGKKNGSFDGGVDLSQRGGVLVRVRDGAVDNLTEERKTIFLFSFFGDIGEVGRERGGKGGGGNMGEIRGEVGGRSGVVGGWEERGRKGKGGQVGRGFWPRDGDVFININKENPPVGRI